VLTEGQLAYYTDATLCNLKGTVVLAKAQLLLPHLEKYGKEHAIEIRRADCDKMYVLVASSRAECQEWFACIKRETESTRKVILEGFLGSCLSVVRKREREKERERERVCVCVCERVCACERERGGEEKKKKGRDSLTICRSS